MRRYPHRGGSVDALARLAHEETSHVVQVAALLARAGWTPRADTPNHYARGPAGRGARREPRRLLDALLVAAFIEARSHERLRLLARGFAATGEAELAGFYRGAGDAEERHAGDLPRARAAAGGTGRFAARLEVLATARPRSWGRCRTSAACTEGRAPASRPVVTTVLELQAWPADLLPRTISFETVSPWTMG